MDRRQFLGLQEGTDQITPTDSFFSQQYRSNAALPQIDLEQWRFTIDGLVENPVQVRYTDILETHEQVANRHTLVCIGNPTGGGWHGTATWSGVPLGYFLQLVGVDDNATHARFYASDGYGTGLDLKLLNHPDTLLATHINGQILSLKQGYPLRLIVPGVYGYKMPKWITRIEFTNHAHHGFWEQRGWSPRGILQTHATIATPHDGQTISGAITIAGDAFAGTRTITAVDVQIDDWPWMPTTLHPIQSPYAAVKWSIDWTPPHVGQYLISVRATDERGFTQYLRQQHPKPDGSQAIHHVVVHVVD